MWELWSLGERTGMVQSKHIGFLSFLGSWFLKDKEEERKIETS